MAGPVNGVRPAEGISAATAVAAAAVGRGATNRLVAVYLLLAVPALLFPGRPASWPLVVLAHLGFAALAWRAGGDVDPEGRVPGGAAGALRWLAATYPLLLLPLFYGELPLLNRSVHGGAYFDELIVGWEFRLFGGQPSRDLAAAWPLAWLSEALHASYVSYYAIIYVPPLMLVLQRRLAELHEMVFTLMLVFFAHYLFFIYFPVQGPRYLAAAPVPEAAQGPVFALTHWLLEKGSSQGAAFPSSHAGVAIAQTVACVRALPRLAPVVALLTLGLCVGAVYGGFHYATDMVAGSALGLVLAVAAPRLAGISSPRGRA